MEHEYLLTDVLQKTWSVESSHGVGRALPGVDEFRDGSGPVDVSDIRAAGSKICWIALSTVVELGFDSGLKVKRMKRIPRVG